MKIVLAMVASVDGKITKWDSPHVIEWASREDQEFFSSLVDRHELVVMGRSTYDAYKDRIKHENGKLRVVMTRTPKKYEIQTIPDKLEFTDESPNKLVNRLSNKGYEEMLLAGGGVINTLFFEDGLIDEFYLTVEPQIFGSGKMIADKQELDISLRLVSVEKLNSRGTLLLKYQVLNKANDNRTEFH